MRHYTLQSLITNFIYDYFIIYRDVSGISKSENAMKEINSQSKTDVNTGKSAIEDYTSQAD